MCRPANSPAGGKPLSGCLFSTNLFRSKEIAIDPVHILAGNPGGGNATEVRAPAALGLLGRAALRRRQSTARRAAARVPAGPFP